MDINVKEIMLDGIQEAEKPVAKNVEMIKDKPFDPQPVLERMSILAASYEALEANINSTDTSRISVAEAVALNSLARAYQAAKEACLARLG